MPNEFRSVQFYSIQKLEKLRESFKEKEIKNQSLRRLMRFVCNFHLKGKKSVSEIRRRMW